MSVSWDNPEKFSDIRSSGANQELFSHKVMESLAKTLQAESAKVIGKNQRLVIRIHDLNLAGEIRVDALGSSQNMRIISAPYWPSMDIEYHLYDNKGKLLATQRNCIKDLDFQQHISPFSHNGTFYYEENLIKMWARNDLKAQVLAVQG